MLEWFSDNLDTIANLIEVVTFIITIVIWLQTTKINRTVRLENRRQKKNVTIRLINGARYYDLPATLRGSQVSRAEILGRIGMIPIDADNKIVDRGFSIAHTSLKSFIEKINITLEQTSDYVLEIPCDDREFAQFNFVEGDVKKSQ